MSKIAHHVALTCPDCGQAFLHQKNELVNQTGTWPKFCPSCTQSVVGDFLAALEDADKNITQLCGAVNTLAGFRKVRAEDFAEKTRAAIAKAKGK